MRLVRALVAPALIAWGASATAAQADPFATPLPIPKVLTSSHITIHMREARVQLVPDGPPTDMWTYDGTFPGPTIRRPAGEPTFIDYVNDLPPAAGPMTVHFHGDHHPSSEDGSPYTNLVAPGAHRKYTLPLEEDGGPERAAFRWYHDHHLGDSSRNVWNGLAGMFIVDDPVDDAVPLPKGRFDVPLMLVDRALLPDNQLKDYFSNPDPNPLNKAVGQENAPPGDAATGDHVIVNGVQTPHLDVTGRRYRFRVLNASNFTAYDLHLSDDATMVQVGADGGLLPAPVPRKTILLGPAERADIVVDFHGAEGKAAQLDSVPREKVTNGTGSASAPIMQFRVGAAVADDSAVPAKLRPLPAWTSKVSGAPTRTWDFGLGYGPSGPVWNINGLTMDPNRVDAKVRLGAIETWQLTNTSNITHYVHMHDVAFLELSRDGKPPDAYEAGLKDTFRVDPGEIVVVAAKFPDYTGRFMIHCHMLDHEDHGMMTQFEVVGSGGKGVPADPGDTAQPSPAGSTPAKHTALGLPSTRRCRPRDRFLFHLRPPRGARLTRARVYLGGRLLRTLRGRQLRRQLGLRGLPSPRFRVTVVVTTSSGRRLRASRVYRVCRRQASASRAAPSTALCYLA